ncbi:MAG: hypothetical protein J5J00_16960 [Deltaproteobacteria bacterium]|nr:hypothetical protein [Deltaproteobacteria bacterium]
MKTILVTSLILLMPLSAFAQGGADKCVEKSEHEKITYFLVDRSDSFANKDNFNKTVTALKEMIESGERLVVGVSTAKAGDTRVLMDFAKPVESVWTSALKIRAQQKKFSECLDSVAAELLNTEESYDHSALLETIGFVSKILSADPSAKKRMIIYSDMMQNSSSISFYSAKELNTAALIKLAEKESLLAKLPQVEIYAAGTGANVSDKKSRDLEQFWQSYFEKAGASLKFFGPVLINMG